MLKVERDLIIDKYTGKERKVTYQDIKNNHDDWINPTDFLPADFDIVSLKIKNRIRIVPGWSIGNGWDGLRLRSKDEVIGWKNDL